MSPAEHIRAVELATAHLADDMSLDARFDALSKLIKQAAAEYDGGEGLDLMTGSLLRALDRCRDMYGIHARRRHLMGVRAKVLAWCDTLRAQPGNT